MLRNLEQLLDYREFVWYMTLKDLKTLTKGSVLGVAWEIIGPLSQVIIYVLLVSVAFKVRLSEDAGTFDYAIYVLAGMLPWRLMMQVISQSANLIRNNTLLIKQVVYPVELLAVTGILQALVGHFVGVAVILILLPFSPIGWRWQLLALPLAWLVLVIFLLGVAWLCSLAGVIFKDLSGLLSIFFSVGFYCTPVILSESMVPRLWWYVIQLNPLSHFIILFQDVFLARSFHPFNAIVCVGLASLSFVAGYVAIGRAKRVIGDYL